MKKFLKNYTILTIALISLVFIFRNNQFLKEHILLGVNLWITKVFPSLFPMFIISDVLIYCHFPELISKLIGLLCSNFNASLSNLTPISITKTNLKRMLMPYIRNYKYESQPQHLVILTCKPPVKRNSSTAVNKYATFVPSRYN